MCIIGKRDLERNCAQKTRTRRIFWIVDDSITRVGPIQFNGLFIIGHVDKR